MLLEIHFQYKIEKKEESEEEEDEEDEDGFMSSKKKDDVPDDPMARKFDLCHLQLCHTD